MQLTHSPSARIPSYTRALPVSPRHPTPYPPMYPPTPCHRTLTSKQPRVAPTLFLLVHPILLAALLRRSLRLDETFDSFGGNLHNPHRPPIFSSLRRPIHRVSTRSTLSYRSPSEYTYSPPLTSRSHCERQQQDRPRGFLQDGGGKVAVYIVSFF